VAEAKGIKKIHLAQGKPRHVEKTLGVDSHAFRWGKGKLKRRATWGLPRKKTGHGVSLGPGGTTNSKTRWQKRAVKRSRAWTRGHVDRKPVDGH